jgi:hypothetical protein
MSDTGGNWLSMWGNQRPNNALSPIDGQPMYGVQPRPAPTFRGVADNVLAQYMGTAPRGVGVNTVLGFAESPAVIGGTRGAANLGNAGQGAAQRMETSGANPQQVWERTGWFRGPDQKWRMEISDSSAALTDHAAKAMNGQRHHSMALSEAIDHPRLFAAYPEAASARVSFDPSRARPGLNGTYEQDLLSPDHWGNIWINPRLGAAGARSSLLHEVQHGVQRAEGFPGGAAPTPGSVGQYLNTAGEVEARAVQARADRPDVRRALPLTDYVERH